MAASSSNMNTTETPMHSRDVSPSRSRRPRNDRSQSADDGAKDSSSANLRLRRGVTTAGTFVPPSPGYNGVTTPLQTPPHSSAGSYYHPPQNNSFNGRPNSFVRQQTADYGGGSPRRSMHIENPARSPSRSRRPSLSHHRTSSTGGQKRHSGYNSFHGGVPIDSAGYTRTPEEYDVEDQGDDGMLGMQNLSMASTAVFKANLRSGDPFDELGHFLSNVNGMLSSLTLSIPHLQVLCDRYRSIQDKLIEYNALVEVNRAQEETIAQKEKLVVSLKEKLERLSTISSAEGNKLRIKIGSLEAEIKAFNEIVSTKKQEMESLADKFEEERELLIHDHEEWKKIQQESFDTEKEVLQTKHEEETREIKEELEAAKKLLVSFEQQKLVQGDDRDRIRKELKRAYTAKMQEVENRCEARIQQTVEVWQQKLQEAQQARAASLKEVENSNESRIREIESLYDQKLQVLKDDFELEKRLVEEHHASELAVLEQKYDDERVHFRESMTRELESLKQMFETESAEKEQLHHALAEAEQLRIKMQEENEKLSALVKRLGSLEEGSSIKSRGDQFYIDAFTQISRDIVNISKEFTSLRHKPSSDVLSQIPQTVPNFLENTDASRFLRQAYVQHTISRILCHRIFSPFLFSLGKRYDKADNLLQAMSNQLREKSTRKESVWRNYSLTAAFTASNAKKNIQVAAAGVIEEIVAAIEPFAEHEKMDKIIGAVTKVVQYTVQIWRYARLEREMIIARLKSEPDDAEWGRHSYDRQNPYLTDPRLVTTLRDRATGRRTLILPLLPIVYREGTVASAARPDMILDDGRLFSEGVALFSDCLPVQHRKMEIQGIPTGAPPETDVSSINTEIRAKSSSYSFEDEGIDSGKVSRATNARAAEHQYTYSEIFPDGDDYDDISSF